MKNSSYIVTVLAFMMTTGCASIVSNSNYPVQIQSQPSNKKFVIKNDQGREIHAGRTPTTVNLPSSDGYMSYAKYTINFTTQGKTKTYPLEADLDGWYIGNIFFGYIIGFLIVDPLTGSMWKLSDTVNINLKSTPILKVKTLQSLTEEEKQRLEPITS